MRCGAGQDRPAEDGGGDGRRQGGFLGGEAAPSDKAGKDGAHQPVLHRGIGKSEA